MVSFSSHLLDVINFIYIDTSTVPVNLVDVRRFSLRNWGGRKMNSMTGAAWNANGNCVCVCFTAEVEIGLTGILGKSSLWIFIVYSYTYVYTSKHLCSPPIVYIQV